MDRNVSNHQSQCLAQRRSLRGNVDRNVVISVFWSNLTTVVPYVGTWIEIKLTVLSLTRAERRSLRGNVDRNTSLKKSIKAL